MSTIRVLVVDDHTLFRRGLVQTISEEPDVDVVGEAGDGLEAVQKVEQLRPDVVFMDLMMPGQDGIVTTAQLVERWPETKVLILTVSEHPTALFQALAVGARGYVVKTASPSQIIDSLRQVHQGWVVISPAMASRFLSQMPTAGDHSGESGAPQQHDQPGLAQLTSREEEVLQLIARAFSNAEIASTLIISENTVKTHVKNILGKLQATSRREALANAAKLGLTVGGTQYLARPRG